MANSNRKSERGIETKLLHAFMMMAADGWHIYYGRDGEVIPPGVTRVRIHESVTVIPAEAFDGNRTIEEVECHDRVKTVEEYAFANCRSLRRVIMRGVKVVEYEAFNDCEALTIVECDKLEIIGDRTFGGCALTSINLPSAKIVEECAFNYCKALTNVVFGKELESIGELAFLRCTSLERIAIPLKDGMITRNDIFTGCKKLKHVDLVEGELHETIAYLQLEEWRNDMNDKVDVINQSLPTTPAGDEYEDVGGKALVIQIWIRSVLHKIICYKAQHRNILNEAAATLQHALPNDIVIKSVLPFLELPSYTFEGED
ncbi:hypothetical protein QTG54_015948 [Skeletonema marinoi]|uniref:Leucine-rich repeat domain-containing protein n=1 Tax=Skeletonema marinoi TaxID=267567 RepID=A0AAD8XT75_9STRA|nr:hypothetical protein QTG54_015948 [Skeletonema marinoi]